ncbi:GIY-YIG nuclease family protein [Chthonobacter albigriseus]|uniref:GIY-YIG nuclease family protein n=1 Tax=Chthonobacter albigriseus TaxID=1683161 RepID=UPI003CC80368
MHRMYVYCATNPSMPGLVKIGMSNVSPTARVDCLGQTTGVPTPFELEWYILTHRPIETEAQIHKVLSAHRVSQNREFFRCSPETARNAAVSLGHRVHGESSGFGIAYTLGRPSYEMKALGVAAILFVPFAVVLFYDVRISLLSALLLTSVPLIGMAIAHTAFASAEEKKIAEAKEADQRQRNSFMNDGVRR